MRAWCCAIRAIEADWVHIREFGSAAEEAAFWRLRATELKDALDDTRESLDEFQASSKELEEELEAELSAADARLETSNERLLKLRDELNEARNKLHEVMSTSTQQQAQIQKELEALRQSSREAAGKLRDVELENDDLEREGRSARPVLETVQA